MVLRQVPVEGVGAEDAAAGRHLVHVVDVHAHHEHAVSVEFEVLAVLEFHSLDGHSIGDLHELLEFSDKGVVLLWAGCLAQLPVPELRVGPPAVGSALLCSIHQRGGGGIIIRTGARREKCCKARGRTKVAQYEEVQVGWDVSDSLHSPGRSGRWGPKVL